MKVSKLILSGLLALSVPMVTHAADAPVPVKPAGAPAQTINLDQIHRMMVGTWQNLADTGFTRQLNGDGTATDRFEGDETATSSGTWALYDGKALPQVFAIRKLPADGVYMTLSEHGDLYLFALTAVDPQTMQVINLDRRQAMSFARLK